MRASLLSFFKNRVCLRSTLGLILACLLVWSGACCEVLAAIPAPLTERHATHQQMACHELPDSADPPCDCLHPEKSFVISGSDTQRLSFALPLVTYSPLFSIQENARISAIQSLATVPRPPPFEMFGPPAFYPSTVLLI